MNHGFKDIVSGFAEVFVYLSHTHSPVYFQSISLPAHRNKQPAFPRQVHKAGCLRKVPLIPYKLRLSQTGLSKS